MTNRSPQNLSIEDLSERLPEEFRTKLISEFKKRNFTNKKLRIYSDGCFDLFHHGHSRQFEQVKNMFPNVELIVGVCSDKDIKTHKGKNVMNDVDRCEGIRHCKWVDEVMPHAPWTPTIDFMELNKFDFVAHDALPYQIPGCDDCYRSIKEAGRFLPTLRSSGISTTDLLVKILRDKDEFYERNFSKGHTLKDLNMGYFEYVNYLGRRVLHRIGNFLKSKLGKEKSE